MLHHLLCCTGSALDGLASREVFSAGDLITSCCWSRWSQKWALILPSSARVSLVTYTAVIAVRYPELDNVQNDLVCFGNYLLGEQATSGGFLPIFWDAPSAYMHAATDIDFFFFNRWLQRISRILAVLGYEGIKRATPEVLRPKRKSSAHSL